LRRDCPSGQWQVRLSNGGVSGGTRAIGNVTSDTGFSSTGEFSLEANAIFDFITDPTMIDYNIRVFNAAVDGFNFIPNTTDACFVLEGDIPVFLGQTRVLVDSPINLETFESCDLPVAPVEPEQCAELTFDRDTEPGIFLWQDCTVGGTDDVWNMTISGQTCFDAQQLPAGAQVFVGRNRVTSTGPFNLEDLGVCL